MLWGFLSRFFEFFVFFSVFRLFGFLWFPRFSDTFEIWPDSLAFFSDFFRILPDSSISFRILLDSLSFFRILPDYLRSLVGSTYCLGFFRIPSCFFIFFRIRLELFSYSFGFSRILCEYFRILLDFLGYFRILSDYCVFFRVLSNYYWTLLGSLRFFQILKNPFVCFGVFRIHTNSLSVSLHFPNSFTFFGFLSKLNRIILSDSSEFSWILSYFPIFFRILSDLDFFRFCMNSCRFSRTF